MVGSRNWTADPAGRRASSMFQRRNCRQSNTGARFARSIGMLLAGSPSRIRLAISPRAPVHLCRVDRAADDSPSQERRRHPIHRCRRCAGHQRGHLRRQEAALGRIRCMAGIDDDAVRRQGLHRAQQLFERGGVDPLDRDAILELAPFTPDESRQRHGGRTGDGEDALCGRLQVQRELHRLPVHVIQEHACHAAPRPLCLWTRRPEADADDRGVREEVAVLIREVQRLVQVGHHDIDAPAAILCLDVVTELLHGLVVREPVGVHVLDEEIDSAKRTALQPFRQQRVAVDGGFVMGRTPVESQHAGDIKRLGRGGGRTDRCRQQPSHDDGYDGVMVRAHSAGKHRSNLICTDCSNAHGPSRVFTVAASPDSGKTRSRIEAIVYTLGSNRPARQLNWPRIALSC